MAVLPPGRGPPPGLGCQHADDLRRHAQSLPSPATGIDHRRRRRYYAGHLVATESCCSSPTRASGPRSPPRHDMTAQPTSTSTGNGKVPTRSPSQARHRPAPTGVIINSTQSGSNSRLSTQALHTRRLLPLRRDSAPAVRWRSTRCLSRYDRRRADRRLRPGRALPDPRRADVAARGCHRRLLLLDARPRLPGAPRGCRQPYSISTKGAVDRTQYMGVRTVNVQIDISGDMAAGYFRIDEVSPPPSPRTWTRPPYSESCTTPSTLPDAPAERTLTVRSTGTRRLGSPAVGYQRSIQLQFVAADPVAYDPAAKTATATPVPPRRRSPPAGRPYRPPPVLHRRARSPPRS